MTGKTECVDPRCDGSTHKVEWEPYVGSLSVARQGQNAKLAQGALNPHDLSAMSPTPPSQLPNYGHALSGQQPQPHYVPVTQQEVAANLPPRGTTAESMTVTQRMLVVETYDQLAEGLADKEETRRKDVAVQNDRCHDMLTRRDSHRDEVSNSVRFARTLNMGVKDTVAYLEVQPEYQDLINAHSKEVDLDNASRTKLLAFCNLFQAVKFPSGVGVATIRSEAKAYISAIMTDPTYTPRLKMSYVGNLVLSASFLGPADHAKLWAVFRARRWSHKIDMVEPGPYDWCSDRVVLGKKMPATTVGTVTIQYVSQIAKGGGDGDANINDDPDDDDSVVSDDDDDESALTRATKLVNSMRVVPKFKVAFSKATVSGRSWVCVGMQSPASMRGSVKYDGGAEDEGTYWVHIWLEYDVAKRTVVAWLGSVCTCVTGEKEPGCAHALTLALLLTAFPLTEEDGTEWDVGGGTVTSNITKVWLPSEQEPVLDMRKPIRFHAQRKSKTDHDPDEAGTRCKVHDVKPGWLFDPADGTRRFEHLTTTAHDACRARTAFIRERRLGELKKEATRLKAGESTRKGGGKGAVRLLPKQARAAVLKRKRCENLVGQICHDEWVGPATARWHYLWNREETLMCHLVGEDGIVKPGMEQLHGIVCQQHRHHHVEQQPN